MQIEKIIDAYGPYWEYVKDRVDSDGWVVSPVGLTDMYYELNVGPIQYEKYPVRRWRPEILSQ